MQHCLLSSSRKYQTCGANTRHLRQAFITLLCVLCMKVDQLRKLLEARFARAAAIGARTLTADWTVSMGGLIGEAAASSLETCIQQALY